MGFYFLTYSTKTKTIFSSASCRASQLATENYTSCQSPLFWLEEKERQRDRRRGGREREKVLLKGAGYQPCHPTLVGHLTERAAFGTDFRISASSELSCCIPVPEKSSLGGSKWEPHSHSEAATGEKILLATWTRARDTQSPSSAGECGAAKVRPGAPRPPSLF